MRGFLVPRKAGWDTHGLPVEIAVEKKLGIDGKERSRPRRRRVQPRLQGDRSSRTSTDWEAMTRRIGFWVDMEDAY